MILNHALNANLLSLPLPLALFLYGIVESPQPSARFFRLLLSYVLLLLLLKFLYQLPIVCGSPPLTFRSSSVDDLDPDIASCKDEAVGLESWEEFQLNLPGRVDYVLGLHKYMRLSSLPHDEG